MGENYYIATSNELPQIIAAIVNKSIYKNNEFVEFGVPMTDNDGNISW